MKYAILTTGLAVALGFGTAAQAADFFPGDLQFQVSGNPFTGTDPVSASIGNEGLTGTGFDRFIFMIGPPTSEPIGLGSGSITTNFSGNPGVVTDLDFGMVSFFNGFTTYMVPTISLGNQETGGLSGIPIFAGVQNILTINYAARGEGSYGGTLNFTPGAIPEPGTWAMLILGMGAVGMAMRGRKQRITTRYAFS